ncbi:hypothetical protein L6452_09519 [Arctium lappa]|uniref:Uncharacterized protein n=1 Tax=Arctium lappa TaxID=4217 RepID=A0ACB9DKK8_ARCLA|nr:hypothetical protein L6452_09519 [Arctium lappa]
MFERFQLMYRWPPQNDVLMEKAFATQVKNRQADIMKVARKRAFGLAKKNERNSDNMDMSTLKQYAPWIRQELWDDLVDKVWSTDGWKTKSKAGKKNRATLVNGSVSKHTCGSVSCAQHRLRLEKKLAREPTIVEVFKETHCKKIISEDGTISYGEFIHPKAAMTLERYEHKMLEKYPNPETRPIGDKDLWGGGSASEERPLLWLWHVV